MKSLLLFCALSASVYADCNTASCKLDAQLMSFQQQNPGTLSGTLLVRHGATNYFRAFGNADDRTNRPNTLNTVFLIASLSKSFVSASILRLLDQGKLQLSDTLSEWIPEYTNAKTMTLENLLRHTSGVPEAYDDPKIENAIDREPVTFQDMLSVIQNKPLHFSPGSRFEYSNTGYVLLGEVVRRVSKQDSAQFLKENFFGPLNLTSISLGPPENPARCYELRRSTREDYQTINNLGPLAAYEVFADTNIYTNASDLADWVEKVTSGSVLSVSSTTAMLTPGLGEYGYGWIIYSDGDGRKAYEHSGEYGDFQTWMRRYSDNNVTLIWLGNQKMDENLLFNLIGNLGNVAAGAPW